MTYFAGKMRGCKAQAYGRASLHCRSGTALPITLALPKVGILPDLPHGAIKTKMPKAPNRLWQTLP